jgi:small conductance mechanosensitive channel
LKIFTPEFWQAFWLHAIEVTTSRGLLIILILLGYAILRSLTNRIVNASIAHVLTQKDRHGTSEERANRLITLQGLAKSGTEWILLFVLVIMLLDAIGTNVAGIITTASIGGVAVGLGAQRLIRDVIAGFFIIIEDQFAVGEYVTISGQPGSIAGAGASGLVESLDMRITRIKDDQGKKWVIANGDITAVVNLSRTPIESSIDIGIAADTNVEQAQAVIDGAGEELLKSSEGKLASAPKSAGVAFWDNTRTNIRVTFIADPRHLSAEQLRIRQVLRKKLTEKQIAVA